VAEVVGAVERAHRDRHRAEAHRAQEHARERARVVENEQHPLLARDAERTQQVAGPARVAEQLGVGQGAVGREHRRLAAAAGDEVAVEQHARVEPLGCHDGVDAGHAPSPGRSWGRRQR
jgi:hypothetical protein